MKISTSNIALNLRPHPGPLGSSGRHRACRRAAASSPAAPPRIVRRVGAFGSRPDFAPLLAGGKDARPRQAGRPDATSTATYGCRHQQLPDGHF